jgi:hypothetical protein
MKACIQNYHILTDHALAHAYHATADHIRLQYVIRSLQFDKYKPLGHKAICQYLNGSRTHLLHSFLSLSQHRHFAYNSWIYEYIISRAATSNSNENMIANPHLFHNVIY